MDLLEVGTTNGDISSPNSSSHSTSDFCCSLTVIAKSLQICRSRRHFRFPSKYSCKLECQLQAGRSGCHFCLLKTFLLIYFQRGVKEKGSPPVILKILVTVRIILKLFLTFKDCGTFQEIQ